MSAPLLLSMTKAVDYLGDIQSAHQLLTTLERTLSSDFSQIETAIHANDLLKTKWHQFKGFAPVFCADALVEEIFKTESLCKKTASNSDRQEALQASVNLLSQLKLLQLEVLAQLAKPFQA
jgi:HPt (histidine-containing phosphotransfer) domain-containing protein